MNDEINPDVLAKWLSPWALKDPCRHDDFRDITYFERQYGTRIKQ
jgi:hypothetical protein